MNQNKIMSREKLESAIQTIRENGIPTGLNCGLENMDNLCRFDRGMLVTVTGVPNMGKSEWIDFLAVQYNKLYGMRTLFYSPENQPIGLHLGKLYQKFEGQEVPQGNEHEQRFKDIMNHIYEHFFFYDYSYEYDVEGLLEVAAELHQTRGIHMLVIDSYNKLLVNPGNNETLEISRILDKLQRFALKHEMLVFLVAHPRKMEREFNGTYKIPKGYDINGSANFLNKSDVVLAVHRNYFPNYTILSVDKVRFNNYGGIGTTYLGYDLRSGNFYDIDEQDIECHRPIPHAPKHVPFEIPSVVEARNGQELLGITVSLFKTLQCTVPEQVNLWEFLTSESHKRLIEQMRALPPSKSKQLKKSLPAVTPSVLIQEKRDTDHIEKHTGLLCVDIDGKDNELPLDRIFDHLRSLPYVAFAQRSASGTGYYAIVRIADGNKHLEHFYALESDFAHAGIVIDKSCKDRIRLRLYSFDENRYVNPATTVYTKQMTASQKKLYPSKRTVSTDLIAELDEMRSRLLHVDVCPTYQAWFEVGCALANELGEEGRTYYHLLSQGYVGYSEQETNEKYNDCMHNKGHYKYYRNTLFYYIHKAMRD